MAYDGTNRGALFKNAEKDDPKHADYNGSLNVDGREYWLNAWLKTSKSGKKFMSLSVRPKKTPAEASGGADINDEIPFAPEWR